MYRIQAWRSIRLFCVCFGISWMPAKAEDRDNKSEPTFASNIASIIYDKCLSCHRAGQVGPFSLSTYEEVRRHSETIAAVVKSGYMPPWKPVHHELRYTNDRSLSPAEKEQLLTWIDAGCPEGERSSIPPPPNFPAEWALGTPDMILEMSGDFVVPADGPDLYRSFVFPLALPEDAWVKAVELRSAASSSMHHALFFLDDTGIARRMDGSDGKAGIAGMGFLGGGVDAGALLGKGTGPLGRLANRFSNRTGSEQPNQERRIDQALARGLGGYVPGTIPTPLPGDYAMLLSKGSDVVMQTHFHPSGKPEVEHAKLGLYFAKQPPEKQLVNIQIPPMFGFGAGIDIPAGDSDFRIVDEFRLPIDVDAIGVGGHAHYICKSMRLTAVLPDRKEILLLDIADWDLDWQDRYFFENSVSLPKQSVLRTEIHYDNSSVNPENPYSPPQRIRWGRQSNDEMGSITLNVVAAEEGKRSVLQDAVRDHFSKAIVERFTSGDGMQRMLMQLDEDRDGKLQQEEVPPRVAGPIFGILDIDRDGGLDSQELQKASELLRSLRGGPQGNRP